MILDFAALLVVVGSVFDALTDNRGTGLGPTLRYAGVALLLGAAQRLAAGGVVAVVGLAALAITWPSARPRVEGATNSERRPFDLAVTALAVVGAFELALNHPLVGVLAVDVTVDVLIVQGLIAALSGGEARPLNGLNAVLIGGLALIVLIEPGLPRATLLLFAALQITLALATNVLWPSGRPVLSGAEESVE